MIKRIFFPAVLAGLLLAGLAGNGQTVSPSTQTVSCGSVPSTLSTAPTGGSAPYTYQWQSSWDNVSWTNISGATSSSYTPPATSIGGNAYYRALIQGTGYSATSAAGTVTVTATALSGGTLSNAYQQLNIGQTVAPLTGTEASGGGCGVLNYVYQWQKSVDFGGTYTDMPGVTTVSYDPGEQTSIIFYRRVVKLGGQTAYSNVADVYVYQIPGAAAPTPSQSIPYNGTASTLTMTGSTITGGNGSYIFVWQGSTDGVNWTNLTSPTPSGGPSNQTYTPTGTFTATTYIRVGMVSHGMTGYSGIATITVPPKLIAGNLTPSSLVVLANTSPGILSLTGSTGGDCSGNYVYQWQSSANGSTWTNIGGATGQTYYPGNLSSGIYYRVQASCGTQTAFSDTMQVSIGTISTDLSYIRTRDISKPMVADTSSARQLTDPNDVKQVTVYYDGLGRPVQTVAKQASPLQKDMVTMQVYDALGREAIQYLPYISPSTDGNYKTNPTGEQSSFNSAQFPNDQFYYARTNYEPSPLNRPVLGVPPGNSWVGHGKGASKAYLINTAADSVRIWTIAFTQGSVPVSSSTYPAGQLLKEMTTDEQNHTVVKYRDKDEHVVLKKVQIWDNPATGHSGWLCTYYVYDITGNLRCVMQPGAVEWLAANSWNFSTGSGQTVADELCFRYEYDDRKRVIIKKVPGAAEVWMVYDMRDRLVMTQDGTLRSATPAKWLVTEYDAQNRPYRTGLLTDANNRAYHQGLAYNSISYPNTSANYEVMTQTFYDDYAWVAGSGAGLPSSMATNYTSNGNYFFTSYLSYPYPLAITAHPIVHGSITGTKTKVIGTASQYLYDVKFYDDHAREIQNISNNYTGGIDTTTIQYNFSGRQMRILVNHLKSGNTAQKHTVLTKMNYDAALRLKNIYKNIDGTGDQLIDSAQYDELGQLKAKYLGNAVDSLVYEYNIRSWLTSVNKSYLTGAAGHYFGMELAYDKATAAVPGTSYGNPRLNGVIAGTIWKSAGDGMNRKYDFSYDNANRLLRAAFTQNSAGAGWDSSKVNFSVSNIGYDANGNILSLNQSGFKVTGSQLIDQLTYSYRPYTNKLRRVDDAANDSSSLLGDFHYKTKQDSDYVYDANGSLTKDNNKGIDTIIYNHLDLPQEVHIRGKGTVKYTYDATGNKLAKLTMDSLSRHANTTLYLNGFVYQQGDTITNPTGGIDTLRFLMHEDGRARLAFHRWTTGVTGYQWEYDFFETDNLGNTREVLTQQRDTALYKATMESAYRATENALFYNIPQTTVARSSVPGTYPSDPNATVPNDSVSRLNGNGFKTGPAIILKVMAGDRFKASVNALYRTGTGSGTVDATSDILTALANGVFSLTGGVKGSVSSLGNGVTSPLLPAINTFRNINTPAPPSAPKAYLNYMVLDDQFNYDSAKSGAVGVSGPDVLGPLAVSDITIRKNGYLYIYVSNETKDINVYFDNLSIVHYSGPLLEENHYYPWGLTMAGISDKALKANYAENKYRYNKGSELQSQEFSDGSGLEYYDTHYRQLDPQLGRWNQIDPKCEININPDSTDADESVVEGVESMSPYTSMGNDPVKHNDPKGDIFGIDNLIGAVVGVAIDYGFQVAENLASGKSLKQSLTQVSGKRLLAAGVIGLATDGIGNIAGKAITKVGTKVVTKLEPMVAQLGKKAVAKQVGVFVEAAAKKGGLTSLKGVLDYVGQTTKEASKFFGWGSKTTITKGIKDFTRKELIENGWNKKTLKALAEAYNDQIVKAEANSATNAAAAARRDQVKAILAQYFGP